MVPGAPVMILWDLNAVPVALTVPFSVVVSAWAPALVISARAASSPSSVAVERIRSVIQREHLDAVVVLVGDVEPAGVDLQMRGMVELAVARAGGAAQRAPLLQHGPIGGVLDQPVRRGIGHPDRPRARDGDALWIVQAAEASDLLA